MSKQKLLFHIGNTLIVLSISGFVYIFFPLVNIYLFPPQIQAISSKNGSYLTIPKISAQAQITENVNPLDKSIYTEPLKKGVAHAKGTKLPGQKGTVFIFAHSSGPPWEQTRNNTIFMRLGELQKGDKIEIVKDGKMYKYYVREKKEVFPSDVKYLFQTEHNQLILQTCTPIGTDYKRLLVFADPEQN